MGIWWTASTTDDYVYSVYLKQQHEQQWADDVQWKGAAYTC
jgi:hypothetical protein